MPSLELTEDERRELHALRDWINDVGNYVTDDGLRIGPNVLDQLRFVDRLITRLDRVESGGRGD
jgi:hypothetical protein